MLPPLSPLPLSLYGTRYCHLLMLPQLKVGQLLLLTQQSYINKLHWFGLIVLPNFEIVAQTHIAIVQNGLTFVANLAELQQQTPIVWRLPLPIVILRPCYRCLQPLAVRMFTFKKCLNFRNRGKTFLSRVASWSKQQSPSDVRARLTMI